MRVEDFGGSEGGSCSGLTLTRRASAMAAHSPCSRAFTLGAAAIVCEVRRGSEVLSLNRLAAHHRTPRQATKPSSCANGASIALHCLGAFKFFFIRSNEIRVHRIHLWIPQTWPARATHYTFIHTHLYKLISHSYRARHSQRPHWPFIGIAFIIPHSEH